MRVEMVALGGVEQGEDDQNTFYEILKDNKKI